jgi:hypothetical protein
MSKVPQLKDIKKIDFHRMSKEESRALHEKMAKGIKEREEEEKRQETERWKPKTEVIGVCHCNGKIVTHTTYTSQYNPMSGSIIIGTASRRQFSRVESMECFCQSCGIVYNADVVKKRK